MERRRTLLLPAVLALLAGTAAPAAAVDQGRGSAGYCQDASGVTVVVDFQQLGGDVLIRCARGEQESGLAALRNAGIEVTGTQRWGPAFVCRLEGKPGSDSEDCVDTPPASAAWMYWTAANGGTWASSQYGAMNRKPPLGSFEGWSFSKDRTAGSNPPPRIGPVRPGQRAEAPPPADVQHGAIPGREGAPRSAAPPSAPPSPATPAASSATPGTVSPSASGPPPSSVGGVAPGGVTWTGGQGVSSPTADESGFPWGALIGGAGALLLGSAAAYVARKRARASG
ncbi:ABC transporter substrate-binding protein [Amycolatopsis sp. NPDC059021]|uniref:ABC transporter substrate-binding protein n=1 Tax=Amycolatopsis sp. NPDC059021 TaxID=3346704 RepID=UPI00366FBFFE